MMLFSQIPQSYPELIVLGPEMVDGINKNGLAIGLKQVTAAEMQVKSDALVRTNEAYNASRAAQETAYANFHAADDALTSWMGKVTGTLGAFFGKRWNRQWVPVGFITPSIRIPGTITERLSLALNMINFLTANPAKEAPNPYVGSQARPRV